LTLSNVTPDTIKVYIVSVHDVDLCDATGNVLKSGKASKTTVDIDAAADDDDDDRRITSTRERKCTTFIVLCPPQTCVHLCSLAPNQQVLSSSSSDDRVPITSWSQVEIESDIQPWSYHQTTDDEHPYLMHFPFAPGRELTDSKNSTMKLAASTTTTYQCTQSENGQLTHFFHGNYHAIDFACPIGTPLYSPVNGKVVEVRDGGNPSSSEDQNVLEVSGIAARNMFYWNSIMVQALEDDDDDDDDDGIEARPIKHEAMVDKQQQEQQQEPKKEDPLFVELVHIQSNSCVVQVGDAVQKGQLLCWSGSVGFSPEPHLHFAAYRSKGRDAATVRVRFERDIISVMKTNVDKKEDTFLMDGSEKVQSSLTNYAECGRETAMKNPKYEEEGDEEEEEALVHVSSFLPRAGGWYNEGGLVCNGASH
jgi:murein DD-endopeptidase MepM/ murein hydrolase activator NlpD